MQNFCVESSLIGINLRNQRLYNMLKQLKFRGWVPIDNQDTNQPISKSMTMIHFDRSSMIFKNHYGDPLEMVNAFYENHALNVDGNTCTYQER